MERFDGWETDESTVGIGHGLGRALKVQREACGRVATKDKGDFPDIYDELTRIRRDADEGLTPHVMAGSPALCRLLGSGDPFLATGELRDRLSTAAARGDREILAYYYALNPGKDSTDRLIEAGSKLAVEYRRARDLSDRGALKLAQIIGSDQEWQVPFMGCGVSVHGWRVTVEGHVLVAKDFRNYRHPRFMFDGEDQELTSEYEQQGDWERHSYGPRTFELSNASHRIQMRRLGTPKIRVSTYVQSDNPAVRVRSTLILLDYVADLTIVRTDESGAAANDGLERDD